MASFLSGVSVELLRSCGEERRAVCVVGAGVSDEYFHSTGLSPSDRIELYKIDAVADHERAEDFALKHARKLQTFLTRRPMAAFNLEAFERLENIRSAKFPKQKIILDGGCGTGMSTDLLARRYPDHFVVGVDKSEVRLSRNRQHGPENSAVIRADLIDIWRLAVMHDWPIEKQYLLYPNPYPVKADFKKRWHGHPSFPLILLLGREIELRASWRGYLEEFSTAARTIFNNADTRACLGLDNSSLSISEVENVLTTSEYISLFERKYVLSNMPVHRLVLRLHHDKDDSNRMAHP